MKRTILLPLLVLVLVACTQTRELTMPEEQPYYLSEREIRALPELHRDRSQIRNVEIRDTFPLATDTDYYFKDVKRYFKIDYAPCILNYVDKVSLQALPSPEPSSKSYSCSRVQFDGDRIFVSYDVRIDPDSLVSRGYGELRQDHVAIYKRNGKLVKKVEIPVNTEMIGQFILDRTNKKLVMEEKGTLQVRCYDYNGTFLRTVDLPKNTPFLSNTHGTWVQRHGLDKPDGRFSPVLVVFNDSLQPVAKVTDCELMHRYVVDFQIDDDCMGRGVSDTIWQVLPDRCVARYVLTGEKLLPRSVYNEPDSTFDKKAHDGKLAMDYLQVGNSSLLYTPLRRAYLMENGEFGFEYLIGHLYNARTGHAINYRVDFNDYNLTRKLSFAEWIIAKGILESPTAILPDLTLVFRCGSYGLKKELAHQLEKPEAEREAIITKKDERFVRKLGLNDLVLIYVKLKKF